MFAWKSGGWLTGDWWLKRRRRGRGWWRGWMNSIGNGWFHIRGFLGGHWYHLAKKLLEETSWHVEKIEVLFVFEMMDKQEIVSIGCV